MPAVFSEAIMLRHEPLRQLSWMQQVVTAADNARLRQDHALISEQPRFYKLRLSCFCCFFLRRTVDDRLQVWVTQFAGAAILGSRLIVHAAKKFFHAQKLLAISAVKDLGIWSVQVVIARRRDDLCVSFLSGDRFFGWRAFWHF